MEVTWVLQCVKCSQAEALLLNIGQDKLAEPLDATFYLSKLEAMGWPNPKKDHNDALVGWVTKHKDHGEIIFMDESISEL